MEFDDNYICYASKANSIVIRANGDLAKCTVALYDTQNMIGHLKEDGELIIHKEKLSYWFKGLETMDKSLLACPYKMQPMNKKCH
jgi:uncharacterized protein